MEKVKTNQIYVTRGMTPEKNKRERETQKARGRGLEKRRIKKKPDGLEDSGRRVRRALQRTAAIMSGEI